MTQQWRLPNSSSAWVASRFPRTGFQHRLLQRRETVKNENDRGAVEFTRRPMHRQFHFHTTKEIKMKNDDESGNRYHPFSRMALDPETKARFQWSSRRSHGIPELLVELLTLRNYIEGDSIHINAECKIGIRCEIDDVRALISMIPARDEDELRTKCAALANPAPVVPSNELLPVTALASVRADIFRLKPKRPLPDWLSKWITV
jgi:hypothetical protein